MFPKEQTSYRKQRGKKLEKVQKSSFEHCRRLKGFLGWEISSGLIKSVPKLRVDITVQKCYVNAESELRGALEIIY